MAYDGFVQIGGIPGESTDDAHKDWVEIISYGHKIEQPGGSSASRVGGRTGARVDIDDFTIMKVLDKSTPTLALYCCNGSHIPKVVLELCEAGGEKHLYMKYTLEDVIVSSVKPGGSAAEQLARPVEEISFKFGKIQWEYIPMDHTGKTQAATQSGWNLETNKAI